MYMYEFPIFSGEGYTYRKSAFGNLALQGYSWEELCPITLSLSACQIPNRQDWRILGKRSCRCHPLWGSTGLSKERSFESRVVDVVLPQLKTSDERLESDEMTKLNLIGVNRIIVQYGMPLPRSITLRYTKRDSFPYNLISGSQSKLRRSSYWWNGQRWRTDWFGNSIKN